MALSKQSLVQGVWVNSAATGVNGEYVGLAGPGSTHAT
jgi:hypothetical protein